MFNTKLPLLRIIKPEGHAGEIICNTVKNPHYIKVNKTIINKINIQVRDQDLNLVQFGPGKISVTLHFRKIKR